jgi:homogentisate 1,2-dioxygenase
MEAERGIKKAKTASHSAPVVDWKVLKYLPGFGGHFCSEALPHALPEAQNNPQKVCI